VADNIAQKVLYVEQRHKKDLLAQVLRGDDVVRALVFTRTKHRANRVAQQLSKQGIAADAIHSNKSQGARQRALAAFDGGRTRVLVATDIMARGIDVEDISHVINFELPNEPESYVHRIGRTARAGAAGTALSFCNAEEVAYLEDIEKLTRLSLTPDDDHQYHSASIAALRGTGKAPKPAGNGRGNGSQNKGGQNKGGQNRGGQSRAGRNGGAQSRGSQSRGASGSQSNGSQSNGSRSNGSRASGRAASNGNSAPQSSRGGNTTRARRGNGANGNVKAHSNGDSSSSTSSATAERRRAEELQTQALASAAAATTQKMFSGNTRRGASDATDEPAIVAFGRSRRKANNRGR